MRRCIVFSLCLAALSASATPVTSKAAADDALLRACQAKGECQDGTLPAAVPITFSRRVDRDESGAPSLFSLESAFGVLSAEDNALVAGLLTQVRESLPATATTTFAQGCDLEDGGAACVKVRLPLQTAADCAAGLHPLCCPLYLTIDGSSKDPADLVWDGTAVVNDYFTNFTDRTLAEWRASGCVPSEDTSPRIFAVDADGAWALTTERTAATVTWEYFPTAVSHIDHLDEPNEPSGNTTAEATTDGKKKYGDMKMVVPLAISIVFLVLVLLALILMYTLDMKQRLVRTESLERNVKLYYVVEGQLLADGEQPKKIHRVPSHSTTSEDDDEDYQVEERGSRRVTRPSIPFDGYAVPPGYGSY